MQGTKTRNTGEGQNRIMLRRLWLPVFIMACISILSGSAGIQTHGWSFTGMDKIGHFILFGLLGISWARSFHANFLNIKQQLVLAVSLTVVFGLLDELHQYRNPLRTFEWADLLADFLGSLTASWTYLHVKPVRSLLETRIPRYLRLPFPKKGTESSN